MKAQRVDAFERFALRMTRWVGSTHSILVHTAFFIVSFALYFWGVALDHILLVVTTLVSLEAIYLSIFIQMSMNRQARRLHAVAKDVEEIQEDIDEIQEDVDEIQEDVEGIEKDIDEIQEDVEGIQEDDESSDGNDHASHDVVLSRIEDTLGTLIKEIAELKKDKK